jgi:hypothetical protein
MIATGSKGKKKSRGKLLSDDGDKVDGRAGPRSENVVLQKSKLSTFDSNYFILSLHPLTISHLLTPPSPAIEHIEDLLTDRKDLLARLNLARNSLVRGHPLLTTSGRELLWERAWTGGEGTAGDEEEDEDDE